MFQIRDLSSCKCFKCCQSTKKIINKILLEKKKNSILLSILTKLSCCHFFFFCYYSLSPSLLEFLIMITNLDQRVIKYATKKKRTPAFVAQTNKSQQRTCLFLKGFSMAALVDGIGCWHLVTASRY